jgi:hypothetical protein
MSIDASRVNAWECCTHVKRARVAERLLNSADDRLKCLVVRSN